MSVEWRIVCLYEWISPLRESLGLLFWPSENFQMVQTYAYRTNHILCRSWGFQMEGNAPEFKISSDGGWATFGSTSFRVLGSLPTAQGRDSSSRTCLVATLKSFPVLKSIIHYTNWLQTRICLLLEMITCTPSEHLTWRDGAEGGVVWIPNSHSGFHLQEKSPDISLALQPSLSCFGFTYVSLALEHCKASHRLYLCLCKFCCFLFHKTGLL